MSSSYILDINPLSNEQLNIFFHPNSKWIKYLNVKPETETTMGKLWEI
jgi:hypothetical protein